MERVGELGVLLSFPSSRAAHRALAGLLERDPPGVVDLVPGASTLLVTHDDPRVIDLALLATIERASAHEDDADGTDASVSTAADTNRALASSARTHEIAVRYDGQDLPDVAAHAGLHPDDVASLHAGALYEVAFVGFEPGFAYLGGLPASLATPRLATPRSRVPAGSVAIGGAWTGVYPAATPGGWRLIGSADDLVHFDARRDPPSLLVPGDRVRFVPR